MHVGYPYICAPVYVEMKSVKQPGCGKKPKRVLANKQNAPHRFKTVVDFYCEASGR